MIAAVGATDVKAASKKWNYENELKVKSGAFTYHAFTSQDEKEVWIYEIGVNEKKEHSKLSIPKTLKNKTVTHIGYTIKKDENNVDVGERNIFGAYAEWYHDLDGSYSSPKGIKEIVIPNSVEVIESTAFSGLDEITTIKIPKKVKKIEEYTFYGCDNLKTVKLPAGLKKIDVKAFTDCPKLEKITLSSKNKMYEVKEGCVITKKNKALVYVFAKDDVFKIPKGTKIIKKNAFSNCPASEVHIPASVKKIEGEAFYRSYLHGNTTLKDVKVAKNNKTYARDGQCVYNKKDGTLAIAIVDDQGVLTISEQVRHLTSQYSLVNWDTYEDDYEKLVLPSKLETITKFTACPLFEAKQVYFTGAQVPTITDTEKGRVTLPRDRKVYVPEAAYTEYKEWYEKYKGYAKVKLNTY